LRRLVQVSLGCHVADGSWPHGDPDDVPTIVASVAKRIACVPPKANSQLRRLFRRFVGRWLRDNLEPIEPGHELDASRWIEGTKYPESRKRDLRETLKTLDFSGSPYSVRNTRVKCFVKDECYSSFKHTRSIFARVDEFKLRVAPFFHELEERLYQHPAFIKHIPVSQRAKYVSDRLKSDGNVYLATDYTAFESHFTRDLLEDCEFQLYRYFAGSNRNALESVGLYCKVVSGINRCEYRNVKAFIRAKRMSGEMSTSVGNGFTNLMVIEFIAHLLGVKDLRCVIEGDDCLAAIPRFFLNLGLDPKLKRIAKLVHRGESSQSLGLDSINRHALLVSLYVGLGLTVKIDVHDHLDTAGFCSMVFDESDFVVVPNPVKKIMNFGWASSKWKGASENTLRQLLRGKAMSVLAEGAGVPILQSMALAYIRLTEGSKVRLDRENWYKMSVLDFTIQPKVVSMSSRMIMEKCYGVTVSEQHALERYFDQLDEIRPIFHPIVSDWITPEQRHYHDTYVFRNSVGNHPVFSLPRDKFIEEFLNRIIIAQDAKTKKVEKPTHAKVKTKVRFGKASGKRGEEGSVLKEASTGQIFGSSNRPGDVSPSR